MRSSAASVRAWVKDIGLSVELEAHGARALRPSKLCVQCTKAKPFHRLSVPGFPPTPALWAADRWPLPTARQFAIEVSLPGQGCSVGFLHRIYRVVIDAFWLFLDDDGWAIASHIALSALMALFPFLIVLTAFAGMVGSQALADTAAEILLEAWPKEVTGPINSEIANVLTGAHSGVVTIGVALAVYFSSSGVESLRIGLNRAYGIKETRSWWLLRLESIAYVLIGAVALIALSFLVILGPLIFNRAQRYAPWIAPFENIVTFARFGAATLVLVITLVVIHLR